MSEERCSRKSGKGKERKRRKEEEDDDDSEHTTTTKKPRTATTSDSIAALCKTKTLRKRLQPDGASSSSKTTKPKKERKPRKKSSTSTSKSRPSTHETLDKYFASSTSQVTETGAKESKGHQLIILFQVENRNGRITEIAAKVIDGDYSTALTEPTYYRCVDQDQLELTHLFEDTPGSDTETVQDRAFTKVFPEMIKWITKTTEDVMEHYGTNTTYYPVLAAHNGFTCHFRVLLDEMKDCSIDTGILAEKNIQFADTLSGLKKAKKQKHQVAETFESLGLPYLHEVFKPGWIYRENKPEEKVELLEHIFTQDSMVGLLRSLPTRTAEEQVKIWKEHEEVKSMFDDLDGAIMETQCRTLLNNGMNYENLCILRDECDDHNLLELLGSRNKSLTFEHNLLELLGSRNKSLVEKIATIFHER